jgi:hypothetical protein
MWSFARAFDISVFMLNILNVVDNHTTWPDYCNQILFDYILILLETSVM